MNIEKNKVVLFHYTLSEEGGETLETSSEKVPMAYLHGQSNILRGLEDALEGKQVGDSLLVTLPPEQAYGQRHEGAEQRAPIKHLIGKHKRLMPGMLVKVNTEHGPRDARVIKAGKFNVDLDMNHPFAGKTLVFDITVADVRDATEEELAHGHAHGVGGHQH